MKTQKEIKDKIKWITKRMENETNHHAVHSQNILRKTIICYLEWVLK